MPTLTEQRDTLRARISTLASNTKMSPDEQNELGRSLDEVKAVELQLQAQEYGKSYQADGGPPANAQDEVVYSDEMPDWAKGFSQKLETLTKFADAQYDNSSRNPGYISDTGGASDPNVKSLGDWAMAVKRGDTKRLTDVYGTKAALSGDAGTTGGYLVPSEFMASILQVMETASPILSRVQTIPVTQPSGEWPALDQYVTPTAGAGDTALAAGLVASMGAEGTASTETEPGFQKIEWRLRTINGHILASNEIEADTPQGLEALFRSVISIAVGAKREHYVLRGTGAGQPLGILNAAAAIGIAPATNSIFAWADALTMRSRFKNVTGGQPMWIIHPGVWPDIGVFESTAGGGVFQANMSVALNQTILGWPIVESEHSPQDDNSGNVILADLGAYVLFQKGGIQIAFSEHAKFLEGQKAWRFEDRLDGQPWMKNSLVLADPQGSYTVSPFVYHND